MTQSLDYFNELPYNFGAFQPASGMASCRQQAVYNPLALLSTNADLPVDSKTSLSGKTTRGNSPKSNEKRTKLDLRSQPVDGSGTWTGPVPTPLGLGSSGQSVEEKQASRLKQAHCHHHVNSTLPSRDVRGGQAKTRIQLPTCEVVTGEGESKYKTELCRNFELTGRCKYGNKCSYAHGKEELVNKRHINLHYKSKKCNKFFERGFCEYGARCQYLHKEDSHIHILDSYCEKLLVWLERNPHLDMSAIMKKTHAYGDRNSFFQKLEQDHSSTTDEPAESL